MAAGKPGRPSDYTEELADAICEEISTSDVSLRQICRRASMPDWRTVWRWLEKNEEFASKYARAKERQGEVVFEDCRDIERKVQNRKMAPDAARVVLQSKQWRASKLASKKYGDRTRTEVTGADGGPIELHSTLDISSLPNEQLRALAGIPIPPR